MICAESSMPEDEYVEKFDNITLNYLRRTFERTQNFDKTPEWVVQKYNAGHFRRIKSRDIPTAIKLKDGGIIGYRVPAHLVMSDLSHVTPLEEWASHSQHKPPRAKDTSRVFTVSEDMQAGSNTDGTQRLDLAVNTQRTAR